MLIKIYFFFILINGSALMFIEFQKDIGEADIASQFSTASTPTGFRFTYPNGTDSSYGGVELEGGVFNGTSAPRKDLAGNLTAPTNATLQGHTGSGGFLDPFIDAADTFTYGIIVFTKFISAQYIIESVDVFTRAIGVPVPDGGIVMFAIMFGFIHVVWIVYMLSGRSHTSFV